MDSIHKVMTTFIEAIRPDQPNSGRNLLQAARFPAKCQVDPHALMNLIGQAVDHLRAYHQSLQDEQSRLLALNPTNATPYYRRDASGEPKYLYLIHPTQTNGQRRREYIGADPDAQNAAMDRVSAYDDLTQVRALIQTASDHLNAINENLARALLATTRGPVSPIW